MLAEKEVGIVVVIMVSLFFVSPWVLAVNGLEKAFPLEAKEVVAVTGGSCFLKPLPKKEVVLEVGAGIGPGANPNLGVSVLAAGGVGVESLDLLFKNPNVGAGLALSWLLLANAAPPLPNENDEAPVPNFMGSVVRLLALCDGFKPKLMLVFRGGGAAVLPILENDGKSDENLVLVASGACSLLTLPFGVEQQTHVFF